MSTLGISLAKDRLGDTYGRLTVVSRAPNRGQRAYWNCVCSCGRERCASSSDLATRKVQSCGCLNEEVRKSKPRKHGYNRTPTYVTWSNMHARCSNPARPDYARYGGRGIVVCERWRDFTMFLADMGEKPTDRSLDRINNNGDYEPGNCRWATASEQRRNQRSKAELRAAAALGEVPHEP